MSQNTKYPSTWSLNHPAASHNNPELGALDRPISSSSFVYAGLIGCSKSAGSILKDTHKQEQKLLRFAVEAQPRAPRAPEPPLTAAPLSQSLARSINQSQQFYKPYLQSCLCHKCPRTDARGGRGAVQGTAFSPSPADITERHVIRSVCGSWQSLD